MDCPYYAILRLVLVNNLAGKSFEILFEKYKTVGCPIYPNYTAEAAY